MWARPKPGSLSRTKTGWRPMMIGSSTSARRARAGDQSPAALTTIGASIRSPEAVATPVARPPDWRMAVTAGYAEAARKRGVIIEQGQEVTAIRQSGGRATGVATASGDLIDAPIVVNAAGLWSPALARLADVELPIIIGRHPVFVLERDPGFGRAHMVYLDLAGGSYVRPETGGLTLTGSLTDDEAQHPMDPELLGSEPGFDEAEIALERTSRALPKLGEARYARGWAGAFDITPDWMPIL